MQKKRKSDAQASLFLLGFNTKALYVIIILMIKSLLLFIFSLNGKINRHQFLLVLVSWFFIGWALLLAMLLTPLLYVVGDMPFLYIILTYGLSTFVFVSACSRRLRDIGCRTSVSIAIITVTLATLFFSILPFSVFLLPSDYEYYLTRETLIKIAGIASIIFAICFLFLSCKPSSTKDIAQID